MSSAPLITLIVLTLFTIASYAANSGCNGVEYDISGNSYFEPVDACVNNLVYFCDANVLKRQSCTLESMYDISAFTADESTVITDVCNTITTEKNANSCQTYCNGESCPAVVKTTYPIINWGTATCSQCVTDSQVLCSFYWHNSPRDDIASGAATQTLHMAGSCVDSSIYSCVYSDGFGYRPSITEYAQTDCTGEATTTQPLRECIVTDDTAQPPTRPISYGCYVDYTASPTRVPTVSTKAPSVHPTAPTPFPTTANPTTRSPTKQPSMALPFTWEHQVATVYEVTMAWGSDSITLSTGDHVVFTDPGPGNVVTITLRYNFDSTTTTLPGLYCNGCYRQVLFQVGDITRDCDGYSARSTASEAALTATYTSDGSAKNMSVAVDLQGACYQSSKIPNTYIGIIQNARTDAPSAAPTTGAPSVPPTTGAPSAPSIPPTKNPTGVPTSASVAPSNVPSQTPSEATIASDETQGSGSNGLGHHVLHGILVCMLLYISSC
eukprot:256447_1